MQHHPTTDCGILATHAHKILPSTPNVIIPCIDLSHPPSRLSYIQLSLTSPGSPSTPDHLFLVESPCTHPTRYTHQHAHWGSHLNSPMTHCLLLALEFLLSLSAVLVHFHLCLFLCLLQTPGLPWRQKKGLKGGGRTPATHTHTHTHCESRGSVPPPKLLPSLCQPRTGFSPPTHLFPPKSNRSPQLSLRQSWVCCLSTPNFLSRFLRTK